MATSNKLSLLSGSYSSSVTSDAKALSSKAQKFIAYLKASAVAGGTLTVKLQHSPDKEYWQDIATFAGLAAPGSQIIQHGSFASANMNLFPNIRAVGTLSGGSATYEVSIWFEDDR